MSARRAGDADGALGFLLESTTPAPPAALAAIVARRRARAQRQARRGAVVALVALAGAGALLATQGSAPPRRPPGAAAVALTPARIRLGTAAAPMASAARAAAPPAALRVGAAGSAAGSALHAAALPKPAGRLLLAGGASCAIGEAVRVSGGGATFLAAAPAHVAAAIWSVSMHVSRRSDLASTLLAVRVGPGVSALSLRVPGGRWHPLTVHDGWALARQHLPLATIGGVELSAHGGGRGATVRVPLRSGTFVAASCSAGTQSGSRGG